MSNTDRPITPEEETELGQALAVAKREPNSESHPEMIFHFPKGSQTVMVMTKSEDISDPMKALVVQKLAEELGKSSHDEDMKWLQPYLGEMYKQWLRDHPSEEE